MQGGLEKSAFLQALQVLLLPSKDHYLEQLAASSGTSLFIFAVIWRQWRDDQMVGDGASGDISLRELQKLNSRRRVLCPGPPEACALSFTGSWGQSALSPNHAWRVLFFIQKQHDEQEFNLAGALSVEAYFLLI